MRQRRVARDAFMTPRARGIDTYARRCGALSLREIFMFCARRAEYTTQRAATCRAGARRRTRVAVSAQIIQVLPARAPPARRLYRLLLLRDYFYAAIVMRVEREDDALLPAIRCCCALR